MHNERLDHKTSKAKGPNKSDEADQSGDGWVDMEDLKSPFEKKKTAKKRPKKEKRK